MPVSYALIDSKVVRKRKNCTRYKSDVVAGTHVILIMFGWILIKGNVSLSKSKLARIVEINSGHGGVYGFSI